MTYMEFYNMTPRTFQNKVKGWTKSQRQPWEIARVLGLIIAQPYSKKKLKLTDIVKFPEEKEVKHPQAHDIRNKTVQDKFTRLAERLGAKPDFSKINNN